MTYDAIHETLMKLATRPEAAARFFKTGDGQYGAHDQFIGVPNPALRILAKQWKDLPTPEILRLVSSPINEERLLALFILIHQYGKGDEKEKERIYKLYLSHIKQVNNWNLVDASSRDILGAHLFERDKEMLCELAQSPSLWERRIAIVATWHFIRKDRFDWTIKLVEFLLRDKEDLMHKAVGWMLREVGERDISVLRAFLDKYAQDMPRTMLRYAIEKLSEKERKAYMQRKL